jgi:predicted tellurium resistance membrane protein TerC
MHDGGGDFGQMILNEGRAWMSDPAAWAGLATLIVLEIVLGIDNLVFIAILADKLPEHQREPAR